MNYYPRFPAHYVAKTMHLSMEEDGAYTRLLDWCYMNERSIPHAQRYAIGRAQKASEKRAIDTILREYFSLENDAWFNDRVGSEIEKAQPKIAAAKANGRKGGRPPKQQETETQEKPIGLETENPLGFLQKPRAKAPQSPIPNKEQKLSTASALDTPRATPPTTSEAGRACLLMREAGCTGTNPNHPDLLAALAEGVQPETLADTVREAVESGKAKPFAWSIATARGRNDEGAKPRGSSHAPATKNLAATDRVLAAIHAGRSQVEHPDDFDPTPTRRLAG